jgi:hypothetical protein
MRRTIKIYFLIEAKIIRLQILMPREVAWYLIYEICDLSYRGFAPGPQSVHTVCEAQPASHSMVNGSFFPVGYNGRWVVTTLFHLVQRLRMHRALLSLSRQFSLSAQEQLDL